jgi:threonine dehydrogenase-like Zn-dependent dehydrogenase
LLSRYAATPLTSQLNEVEAWGNPVLSSTLGGYGYRLIAPARSLERYEFLPLEPQPGEVVVEVVGCGVCHTDVGFAFDGVPTRAPLPLTLGHEISGRVTAAGARAGQWEGCNVIVPAVIPALLEQPMLMTRLDREGIPHTQFKYSEDTGQFAVIREQAGTFSDSIRLWSQS